MHRPIEGSSDLTEDAPRDAKRATADITPRGDASRERPDPGCDETGRELLNYETTRNYEQLATANPIEGSGMKLLTPRP